MAYFIFYLIFLFSNLKCFNVKTDATKLKLQLRENLESDAIKNELFATI